MHSKCFLQHWHYMCILIALKSQQPNANDTDKKTFFGKKREKEWIKNSNTKSKTAQEQQLEMAAAAAAVANCWSTIKPNDDKLCVGCEYCWLFDFVIFLNKHARKWVMLLGLDCNPAQAYKECNTIAWKCCDVLCCGVEIQWAEISKVCTYNGISGYEHINEIILDSINTHGKRFYMNSQFSFPFMDSLFFVDGWHPINVSQLLNSITISFDSKRIQIPLQNEKSVLFISILRTFERKKQTNEFYSFKSSLSSRRVSTSEFHANLCKYKESFRATINIVWP